MNYEKENAHLDEVNQEKTPLKPPTNSIQGGCCDSCRYTTSNYGKRLQDTCAFLNCPCHSKPQDIQPEWESAFDQTFPISIDYVELNKDPEKTNVFVAIENDTRHKRALNKHEATKRFIRELLLSYKQKILEGLPKESRKTHKTDLFAAGFNSALSQARKVVEDIIP